MGLVRFGGCDGKIPNCLPIMHVELYGPLCRPRAQILERRVEIPGGGVAQLVLLTIVENGQALRAAALARVRGGRHASIVSKPETVTIRNARGRIV